MATPPPPSSTPVPPEDNDNDNLLAVRLRITGTVQGVWYRASAVSQARRVGVSGTVSNAADGSVVATVAGPPAAVDAFVAWARVGPPAATVRGVEVTRLPGSGGVKLGGGMTIVRSG
ncbi:hypothetical protein MMPV_005721 [Pyropia vietnamensis]